MNTQQYVQPVQYAQTYATQQFIQPSTQTFVGPATQQVQYTTGSYQTPWMQGSPITTVCTVHTMS